MEVTITPSSVGGTVHAINSKSHIHRLLICAALSTEPTSVFCPNSSDDIESTARCLCALGAIINRAGPYYHVIPIQKHTQNALLHCSESGSTLRFLLPVAAALGIDVKLYMSGRLPDRPIDPLIDQITAHGCRVLRQTHNVIQCVGQLKYGEYTIPGDISSQFISGLLFALPLLGGESVLNITGTMESVGYVQMTLDTIAAAGIKIISQPGRFIIPGGQHYKLPQDVPVEGDWSNAAFWLAMGALSDKSVTCTGLNHLSTQKDKRIVRILRRFGARVTTTPDSATASAGKLEGIVIDASDIPDLVPVLAVLGAAAEGVTKITHAERLRMKESDRLSSITALLTSLGAEVRERRTRLVIKGTGKLTGGSVDSFGDHRIAMSAACASLICSSPVKLSGAQAVRKSYPDFWDEFERLGGIVERSDSL